MKKINLYLIESQQSSMIDYVQFLTKEAPFNLIGYSEYGEKALSQVEQKRPGIVVLEIGIKDSLWVYANLIETIKNISSDIKILVVSQFGETRLVGLLIHQGVHGFRTFRSPLNEIKTALLNIYNNKYDFKYISTTTPKLALSDREKAILKSLLAGHIIKQIACQLGISEDAINRSLRKLKKEFKAVTTFQLVGKAAMIGIA